jgi:hypothetical protein
MIEHRSADPGSATPTRGVRSIATSLFGGAILATAASATLAQTYVASV